MRSAVVVVVGLIAAEARADGITAGTTGPEHETSAVASGAVGAGVRGDASYSTVELRLDAEWRGAKIGLGARAVWEDGAFRQADWARKADAVTILRDLEVTLGPVAIAAGGLAPSHVGHVVDGYRVAIDDRMHTGARIAVTEAAVETRAEIDDVIDPTVIAGSATVWPVPAWGVFAAAAIEPNPPMTGDRRDSVVEFGVARRWRGDAAIADLGGSIDVEPSRGASAIAFANAALDRGGVRFTGAADVRAGSGTVGSAFGPLYRVERLGRLDELARSGIGAGISIGAIARAGFIDVSLRQRPGLGTLAMLGGGAPMSRRIQAATWLAAGRRDAAGTAELRVAWARRLFGALDVARLYQFDAMTPRAAWSVVAWFGASSD